MNAKELIELGEKTLKGAGIESAKVDSRLILEHLLGINQNKLFTIWSDVQDERRCDAYFGLIDMRASRVPLQHITGKQDFMDFTFEVNKNVLIPRPETELLVERVLEYCNEKGKSLDILDLCTGSGAIGISISKMYKKAKVVCSDIDDEAIATSEKNAKNLDAKVKVKKSNMFKGFRKTFGNQKFDVIVSNPPYIPSVYIESLEPEVRIHEPRLALDGGSSGIVFFENIFLEAHRHLKKGGMLFLEMGHDQGKSLTDLAINQGEYEDIKIERDLAGLDRIFVCRRK